MGRPLIAVPGRFSQSASALRYRAVVNAQALLDAVLRAGGEPLTVAPRALTCDPLVDLEVASGEVAALLGWAEGVLLPGGGDLDPATYGQPVRSGEVYDVDPVQDAFDLAVAAWAFEAGIPVLAICRGMQVVNVVRGGTLDQHMSVPHRNRRHQVLLDGGLAGRTLGPSVSVSCYHHQQVDLLGSGLRIAGRADDGTPEAFESAAPTGWFLGLQWHPEDDAATDPSHQAAFDALVASAAVGAGRTVSTGALDGGARPA